MNYHKPIIYHHAFNSGFDEKSLKNFGYLSVEGLLHGINNDYSNITGWGAQINMSYPEIVAQSSRSKDIKWKVTQGKTEEKGLRTKNLTVPKYGGCIEIVEYDPTEILSVEANTVSGSVEDP